MSDSPKRLGFAPPQNEKWCRFLATVVGPLICWLAPFLFFYFISAIQEVSGDAFLNQIFQKLRMSSNIFLMIFGFLTYFAFSSITCGILASFFLQQFVDNTKKEPMLQVGFWIRVAFVIPFCLHPGFLCCWAWFMTPLHLWIFDIAFHRTLPSFQNGRYLEFFDRWKTPDDK